MRFQPSRTTRVCALCALVLTLLILVNPGQVTHCWLWTPYKAFVGFVGFVGKSGIGIGIGLGLGLGLGAIKIVGTSLWETSQARLY